MEYKLMVTETMVDMAMEKSINMIQVI